MFQFKQIIQTLLPGVHGSLSDKELLSMLPWSENSKKTHLRLSSSLEWGGNCPVNPSVVEKIAEDDTRFASLTLASDSTESRTRALVDYARSCIRIRMILRVVDARSVSIYLAAFIRAEITDESLPLSLERISRVLDDSTQAQKFWSHQFWALPTPVVLGDLKHVVLQSKVHVPLRHLSNLGHGSFATVDSVKDVMNGKQYARKVYHPVPRKRLVLEGFQKELEAIKRLGKHSHIVAYAGSYIAGSEIGILLTPIAESNMREFLSSIVDEGLSMSSRQFLHKSLGCLMSGLAFMHERGIRHKDIKPANILIHGANVLYADFGTALDFARLDTSATTGPIGPITKKYSAREVHEVERRDTRADVYSLGCVFLEICTVLAELDLEAFEETLTGDTGSWWENGVYAFNINTIQTQLDRIGETGIIREPMDWCQLMLKDDPQERPRIQALKDSIYYILEQKKNRHIFFCDDCLYYQKVPTFCAIPQLNDSCLAPSLTNNKPPTSAPKAFDKSSIPSDTGSISGRISPLEYIPRVSKPSSSTPPHGNSTSKILTIKPPKSGFLSGYAVPAYSHTATALLAYKALEDDELSFEEDAKIIISSFSNSGWWCGTYGGHTGLFPSSHVEVDQVSIARALWAWNTLEDDELRFEKGARIFVYSYPNDQWWYGTHKGQYGLFPSNYVKVEGARRMI